MCPSSCLNRPLVLLALAACWVAACEATVDLEPPDHEPSLVVHAFFNPDSTWSVALGRSRTFSEGASDAPVPVQDARVRIRWASDTLALANVGPGRYASPEGMRPGSAGVYALDVTAPRFPAVRASGALPTRPDVEVLEVARTGAGGPFSGGTFRIRMRLSDRPGRHYYRLGIYRLDRGGSPGTYLPVPFQSTDPALHYDYDTVGDVSLEGPGTRIFDQAVLDDRLFEGQERVLSMVADLGGPAGSLRFVVSSLSPDFFEYHRTLLLQQAALDNPFGEPIAVYTNVENGIGVFAGYSNTVIDVPLPP